MGVARPIKVLDDGAAMVNVKNMETKIVKLAHIRIDFGGIMQAVGNER